MKGGATCLLVILALVGRAIAGGKTLRGKVVESGHMAPSYDSMRIMLDSGTSRERLALPTSQGTFAL